MHLFTFHVSLILIDFIFVLQMIKPGQSPSALQQWAAGGVYMQTKQGHYTKMDMSACRLSSGQKS